MNKAFVRESDAPPPKCACGFLGTAVTPEVVAAAVTDSAPIADSSDVYYCSRASCPVAYFDGWGASLPADVLTVRAYPKDPGGPVCTCLSISAVEIVEEAGRGVKDAVLRILKHLKTHPDCVRPDGTTCERDARRLFLEHRPEPE